MISRLVADDTLSIINGEGETVLSISEEFEEPRATLRIQGKITLEAAHDFEDELASLVSVCKNIIIDFSGTEYISSDGLQALLNTQKTLDKSRGTSLVLRGLGANLKKQFTETGFIELFQIEE